MPQRVIVPTNGDATVLALETFALPAALGEGEVLVKVSYAGINFIDTYYRGGLYPKPLPFVAGDEGAGAILQVGAGVDASRVGQRVAFFRGSGGAYATHAVVKAADAFPVPDGVADDAAASLMLQGCTAHYLTRSCYAVGPGSVVLVHAAAGGTGLLITQMVKAFGGTVIGTCGGAAKAELAQTVGRCDVVIDYAATPKWEDEVRRLYPAGVNAVLDGVGKSTFLAGLTVLKERGSMVTFGNASGPVDPIAPLLLTKYGSISLQRPSLFAYSNPGEIEERVREVFQLVTEGKLTPTIGKVFKLHKAKDAHLLLESRQSTGKILVNCEE